MPDKIVSLGAIQKGRPASRIRGRQPISDIFGQGEGVDAIRTVPGSDEKSH